MTNADLARLTGFTNLDRIAHRPDRLEQAIAFAGAKLDRLEPSVPLRIKAALAEYAKRATHLLETPERYDD
ncbi:MAG: hypothetical protein WBC44_02955 [Planctomycetaceae bacterium]